MPGHRLAALLASEAPSLARSTSAGALEAELLARRDAGRAAWPQLAVDDADFVRHLARNAPDDLPPIGHAGELWLACACAAGSSRAIRAFQEQYRGVMERAAARIDPRVADEAAQVVLTSLFVREGDAAAGITAYGGRCSLARWLATVSARAAIKLRRRHSERPHESVSMVTYAAASDEPELVLLRAKYAPELDAALRAALAELDARTRLLLRLYYGESWSLERLGAFSKISRATASRRLADARDALYEGAKRRLADRLGLTSSEYASIAALVGVGLEASVVRLLGDGELPDNPAAGAACRPSA